jgi:tetratricopeptide (TPR) repeat protein
MGREAGDDLIAFAEQRERGNQSAFTPRQVLFVVGALGGVALLITGIAMLTSTPNEVSAAPTDEISAEPIAIEPVEAELIREPLHEPEVVVAPPIAELAVAADVPEPEPKPATPVSKPPRKSTSSRRAVPAPTPEPQAAVVQAELASLDAQQLTARADALYLQGHTGVGASYYRRALELDPDYAPALVGMGRSILRAKKYSEAMRNASRALQLARGVDARPGLEAAAIYQMGRVHYERGERDAARRLFRQSISLPVTPPEAWFYLGEALSSDNSPAARDAYERYLELMAEGHLAERARRAIR